MSSGSAKLSFVCWLGAVGVAISQSKETLSTQSVEAKVTRNDAVVSLLALVFRIKDKFVMVGSKTVRNYAQARVC